MKVERFGVYLQVTNLDRARAFYERVLDKQMLDDRFVVEGPLKLFRFADPDENALELFSLHA